MKDERRTKSAGSILVVDDDKPTLKLLDGILASAHFQVHAVSTAFEAIEMCESKKPDAILMDLNMPGVDGYHLCAIIREQFGEIPVIVITGDKSPKICSKVIGKGANDFITKPFAGGEVLIRVKNAVEMKRLRTEIETQCDHQYEIEDQLSEVITDFKEWSEASGEFAKKAQASQILTDIHEEKIFSANDFEAIFDSSE